MRPLLRVAVAVALVGSLLGGVGGATAGPTIRVSVNGASVSDGGRIVVEEARLSIDVAASADLETVVVRIDGRDVARYTPNGTGLERTLDPDLPARSSGVQVIATTANATASHYVTIYRDTIPPAIGLSAPVDVAPGHVFPSGRIEVPANLTIRGTVRDVSGLSSFEAAIMVGGGSAATSRLTNGTFALSTTLPAGNATLLVRATDRFGNRRLATARLRVTDEKAPTLSVTGWPANGTHRETITLNVTATDDVGVRTITLEREGHPERTILPPVESLFGRGRDTVRRTVRIPLDPGNQTITFRATDTGNHSTTLERTVTYDPITPREAAVPDIVVHDATSGLRSRTAYHLDATVTNGSVERVVLEAITDDHTVLAYAVRYDGPPTHTIHLNRTLSVQGPTTVRIHVTDAYGREYVRRITIDPGASADWVTATPTPTPPTTTERPTSTAAPTPRPATHTPVVESVDVQVEPAITPVSDSMVPLSPAVVPIALLVAAWLLRQ